MYPSRMNISDLDPSIALGFFCKTEEDFDDLCEQINEVYFPNRTLVVELVLIAVSSCILE